jgi:primosomal protein N' (replication factor Y)
VSVRGLFDEPADRYAEVAVPVPLRRTFTYRVPAALAVRVAPGTRVAVPFAGRKMAAFVVSVGDRAPDGVRLRDVAGVLDAEPIFPAELLSFLAVAADYYVHPVGEVLRAAAPALGRGDLRRLRTSGFLEDGEDLAGRRVGTRTVRFVKAAGPDAAEQRLGRAQRAVLDALLGRGELSMADLGDVVRSPAAAVRGLAEKELVTVEEREVRDDPYFADAIAPDSPPEPNPAQVAAIGAMTDAIRAHRAEPFLLFGVTGSGKTEVYLRVIGEALGARRGALVLVPEIALTPQLVARFRARFGDAIAVLHSGLGERARHDAWAALRSGRVRLAIGARSALFAPVPDLGVIVVDEEHDPSFKQEEGFRYHARDLALLRAHRAGAVAILGSATPSVESFHRARSGKTRLCELPERATRQRLPPVEIVDLRRNPVGPSGHPFVSAPLHRALERCLAAGEQAILFLNRRGFAHSVRCEACGEVASCPACSVALTEHRSAGVLRCHYCDFATPPGETCPKCRAPELVRIGVGTERHEEELARIFAPARVGRLDRDVASGAGAEEVLGKLRRKEIDVLVGTQMVTKGHDVPGVTVVGVVLADQSLAFPDFRAQERTFSLLSQVAGRAGRGDRPGRVFVQTYQPGEPAIVRAAEHDYVGFFTDEVERRRELGYPPFGRLVAIRIDAGGDEAARGAAATLAAVAHRTTDGASGRVRVTGPAPAPIARVRGRWRHRLLLRSPDRAALRRVTLAVAARIDEGLAPARASIDVDPVSML